MKHFPERVGLQVEMKSGKNLTKPPSKDAPCTQSSIHRSADAETGKVPLGEISTQDSWAHLETYSGPSQRQLQAGSPQAKVLAWTQEEDSHMLGPWLFSCLAFWGSRRRKVRETREEK